MAELILEQPRAVGQCIECAARFRFATGEQRVWYRVEAAQASAVTTLADPFVVATVHLAMKAGETVTVHGDVSPSLLRNLEAFQQAWSAWKPQRYRQVEITATGVGDPPADPQREAISGFSGGVDSCFTALRHARGVTTRFPLPLRASVMVHGFDIPLDDEDGFRRATDKAERQLRTLGLELFRVATNFKQQPVDWVDAFGAAVAAVLSLFQRRFRYGLVAQGVPFGAYRSIVEGSNPLSDPLLSSDVFTIIPDGAGFQRTDKLAELAHWPEGLADLRVCWKNPIRDENCCVCEKCIRNILSMRALGLPRPRGFPRDVADDQILALVPMKPIKIDIGYGPIVAAADASGRGEESWVRALRKAIRLSRAYYQLRQVRGGMRIWRLGRSLGLAG